MKSFFILIHAGTCFKVWGKNTFFGGQGFCSYYMFKTTFSGQKKMWGGTKKIGGHCPRMPPVATGLHSWPSWVRSDRSQVACLPRVTSQIVVAPIKALFAITNCLLLAHLSEGRRKFPATKHTNLRATQRQRQITELLPGRAAHEAVVVVQSHGVEQHEHVAADADRLHVVAPEALEKPAVRTRARTAVKQMRGGFKLDEH